MSPWNLPVSWLQQKTSNCARPVWSSSSWQNGGLVFCLSRSGGRGGRLFPDFLLSSCFTAFENRTMVATVAVRTRMKRRCQQKYPSGSSQATCQCSLRLKKRESSTRSRGGGRWRKMSGRSQMVRRIGRIYTRAGGP